jgi:hypothetical protein
MSSTETKLAKENLNKLEMLKYDEEMFQNYKPFLPNKISSI